MYIYLPRPCICTYSLPVFVIHWYSIFSLEHHIIWYKCRKIFPVGSGDTRITIVCLYYITGIFGDNYKSWMLYMVKSTSLELEIGKGGGFLKSKNFTQTIYPEPNFWRTTMMNKIIWINIVNNISWHNKHVVKLQFLNLCLYS